jgi:Family of unknown function (DUF6282)
LDLKQQDAEGMAVVTGNVFDGSAVSDLMVGGIDIHIHTNPHLFPEIHAQDIMALANQAHSAGMRALVVKDVGVTTTGTTYLATRLGPGIPIYGAHVMNLASGGINPRAVWVALHHGDGAKVIHFPTGDTLNHFDYRKKFYSGVNLSLTEDQAITVLKDGQLIPEVREVISLIKERDACLATSHLSATESHAVVKEAKNQGLRKIIISHARWAMTRLTMSDLQTFAAMGCFIEFEFCPMTALMHFVHGEPTANPLDIVRDMKEIGIEHCFISSDLGQLYSPLPVDGMRTYVAILRKCGISDDEVRTMFHHNPARLIDLE